MVVERKEKYVPQGGSHDQMRGCMELSSVFWTLWVTSLADLYLVAGMEMPMGMPLADLQLQGA